MERERESRLILELRDQVNDLLAAAQLLTPLVRERGSDQDADSLAALHQSLYRLIRTVGHLELCGSADPIFRPRTVDLGALCRDVGRLVDGVAEALDVSVWWEIDKEGVFSLADCALLEGAILNLVANAVQVSGPGGRVVLRSGTAKDRWTVTVKDSGPGLTIEDPDADPLLKRPGGVGMGLEAARRAAALHGGVLVLENGEDTGSRAVLSIPIREPGENDVVKSGGMGFDRTGGFSPLLVEFSPLLPQRYYRLEELE